MEPEFRKAREADASSANGTTVMRRVMRACVVTRNRGGKGALVSGTPSGSSTTSTAGGLAGGCLALLPADESRRPADTIFVIWSIVRRSSPSIAAASATTDFRSWSMLSRAARSRAEDVLASSAMPAPPRAQLRLANETPRCSVWPTSGQ